ncbi:MAG: ATP-grasp domain-containing protein [Leptospiraceae bacterium]|nr:ATP-grasp domain-containing protein [Leptospiraceae bacterium]MCP5512059.1 ATP-grasp domain-containing protein [Leptospiraceae bacterium]
MTQTVVLISDIYENSNDLTKEYIQEWDNKKSIEYLGDTILDLGYSLEIIDSFQNPELVLDFLQKNLYRKEDFLVWNLVEGYFSRNRETYVPGFAEYLGYPYAGSDSYLQNLSLDKYLSKVRIEQLGIHTPRSFLCYDRLDLEQKLSYPLFLKPNFEGSSLGISEISIVHSDEEFKRTMESFELKYFPILVEEYFPGDEYTVSVLGTYESVEISKICRIEIEGMYSEEKKSKDFMEEKIIPIEDLEKSRYITETTQKICRSIGFHGYGRLDWKEDEKGMPGFLEMNFTPGLSPYYSAFPICFRESGKNYSELIQEIINISKKDYNNIARLYGKRVSDEKIIRN